MSRLMTRLFRVAAAAAIGCAAGAAGAETCELELKRVDERSGRGSSALENMLTWVSAQHLWTDLGAERPDMDEQFRKVVKKEPDAYECDKPFRCVARMGAGQVGLVFDSTDLKKKAYNRLYLDRNGNGDLTDDEVIKARSAGSRPWGDAVYAEFPTITMPLKAGDVEFDYSFMVSVEVYGSDEHRYVQAAIQAKVYRQGEITLDGKQRKIYLVDYNSNGRFDDLYKVDGEARTSDGRIWPTDGDILLVDPEKMDADVNWYDPTVNDSRLYVSKMVNIEGRFHDLSISAAGDKLTLTASKAAVGHVRNPNASFSAIVYGDAGLLKIRGTKDSPVALPEGQWRLLSYTIDLTSTSQPATTPGDAPQRKAGILRRLVASVLGSGVLSDGPGPRFTLVSAQGTRDCKPVTVKKGQTVELPFGPPFKPAVRVEEWRRSRDRAELGMVLIGSAGELCSNLMVKGDRPDAPTFAVVAPDGEIVERGKFEYG